MKSVITIAYFFPPEGSAGTYRSLRFVRNLPKAGWSPTVISATPYQYERFDPELLRLVPRETEVIPVRGRDLWQAIQARRDQRTQETLSTASAEVAERIRATHRAPFRSFIRRGVKTLEASYYHPDFAKHWIRPAIEATLKACRRRRPQAIWATAGPVSAWVVAREVSRRTGVPYVLDLRDPWGLSYYESEFRWPERVKRRIRRTMCDLFKGAQSVVLLSDAVAEAYSRAFPGALDPRRIHVIPNGYEGAIEEFAPAEGSRFTILYAGTMSSYRYDTLLQALLLFKSTDPAKARLLRFRFVGEDMDALGREAAALGLSDIVEIAGPTTHSEITRLQREAHALLVLGRFSTINGHELFVGAKVFGYLKARRPVAGVLPQDEARKILTRVGVSSVADVDSPPAIASMFRTLTDAWSTGTLRGFLPDRAQCELFSAERQTEALVRALEGAPALEPFVPGTVEVPGFLRAQRVGCTA